MAYKGKSEYSHLEYLLMAAMKNDVDQLWIAYRDADSVRYRAFADIYKEKEFTSIFLGRLQTSELVEFTEHLLIYAASYMFSQSASEYEKSYIEPGEYAHTPKPAKTRTFQERIFGIYLTFSLFFLQPSQFVCPIRITSTQFDNLFHFLEKELLPEHLDAAFCLFRLVDHSAFTFVPFSEDYNPLLARRYDFDELNYTNFDQEDTDLVEVDNLRNIRAIGQDSSLEEIAKIHALYSEKQKKVGTKGPSVKTNIANYVKNLLEECEASLTTTTFAEIHGNPKGPKHSRAGIREKAYGGKAIQRRDRRHRQDYTEFDGLNVPGLFEGYQSPNKRKNVKLEMDPLQEQITRELNAEQRKSERVRRETLTNEELNEEMLVEMEVEKDVKRRKRQKNEKQENKSIIQTRRMSKLTSEESGSTPSTSKQADIEEDFVRRKQPTRRSIAPKPKLNEETAQTPTTSEKTVMQSPINMVEEEAAESEADALFAQIHNLFKDE